jgi:hypothetical protein
MALKKLACFHDSVINYAAAVHFKGLHGHHTSIFRPVYVSSLSVRETMFASNTDPRKLFHLQ